MTPEEFHDALHAEVGRPRRETRTRYVGKQTIKEVVEEPGAHRAAWAFAHVNTQSHAIKVQVNLDLQQNKLSQADYLRLKNLALQGIRTYWSRSVHVRNESFAIDVNAVHNVKNAVQVDLIVENGKQYSRSHNVGVLGIDASLFYNKGYFSSQVDADQDFMLTAAHEFGHSVLMEFGSIGHSWTHKGSTSLLQSVKGTTPGYPQTGEIDLMRYFDAKKNYASLPVLVKDSRASEFDAKCLLWMSTLSP